GHDDPQYPKAEQLNDFELGWRFKTSDFQLNTNLYYMGYRNQLVRTGELDKEGRALRKNSGQSHRLGIELSANWQISKKLEIRPNIALSQNKNKDFVSFTNNEPQHFTHTAISFSPNIIAGNMVRYRPFKHV